MDIDIVYNSKEEARYNYQHLSIKSSDPERLVLACPLYGKYKDGPSSSKDSQRYDTSL
jgi:hypothetical protein